MEYLKLVSEKSMFREQLEYINEMLKHNQHHLADSKNKDSYEELIAIYLNAKQADLSAKDQKRLKKIENKLCPVDSNISKLSKQGYVRQRLEDELGSMSDRDFNKCNNLLDLYAKLEAMPPRGKI